MNALKKVAEELSSRRKTDTLRQIIFETVSESRELMLEKCLRQSLSGAAADSFVIKEMLKDAAFLEAPFYLAALRAVPSVAYGTEEQTWTYKAEQILQSVIEASNNIFMDNPLYSLKEEDMTVFFLPDRDRCAIFNEIESRLNDAGGAELLLSMAEHPCALMETHQVFVGLKQDLAEKYAIWEKLHRMHPLIKDTLYYIRDHYMDNVTLEMVSSQIHASPVYLSRLFYKEIGQTFIDYLTHYRIKQAKMLLKFTNMKTYEIGEKVGYKNSKYFLRVFRKQEGMTPGEYRES